MTTQKSLIILGGSPSPVTDIDIENDIVSAVVITKIKVSNNNTMTSAVPNGRCDAIDITAAGSPLSANGLLIAPLSLVS